MSAGSGRERPRLVIVVSHPIQHFAPLYRETAAQGQVDLHVLFCCDWGVRAYLDPAFGREVEWDVPLLNGYEHEFLRIRRRPRTISFLEVDNPGVGDRLEALQPDVVLVHGYGCRTMWRAAEWAARGGALALLSSDSHAGKEVHPLKAFVKKAIVGRFYDRLDGALAAGDSNRDYHRRFGLPPERIFESRLPADGARFAEAASRRQELRRRVRERLSIPDDSFVALFCGNLTPWKRPRDFAEAVVRARSAGASVVGLVVGDGPERRSFEVLAASPVSDCLRTTGFVKQAAIVDFYAAADALVLTSERDAHPLVVTEALFFSLPVVVSDAVGCVGPTDTARPGENALVYRCGDVMALSEILRSLSRDAALVSRLGTASGRMAAENDAPAAARLVADAVTAVLRLGPRSGRRRLVAAPILS